MPGCSDYHKLCLSCGFTKRLLWVRERKPRYKTLKRGKKKKKRRNRGRMQMKKGERGGGTRVGKRRVVGAARRQPESHIWKWFCNYCKSVSSKGKVFFSMPPALHIKLPLWESWALNTPQETWKITRFSFAFARWRVELEYKYVYHVQ